MPVSHTTRVFLGVGPVFLRKRGATTGLRYIGDVKAFSESADTESIDTTQHTTPGGGLLSSLQRVKGMKIEVELQEFSPDNAALAAQGVKSVVAGGAVADERQLAYPGGYIRLDRLPASITSVKNAAGAVTYVAGTDYVLDGSMLFLPADTNIVSGENLKITYVAKAADVIQVLTAASDEYEVVFDGVNEQESGKRARVKYHRVMFGFAGGKDWINEATRTMKLTGKILQDATQPLGASQWAVEEYEQ